MGPPGLQHGVVEVAEMAELRVQFPAELAGIGDPERRRLDPGHPDQLCGEPGKVLVRQVGLGERESTLRACGPISPSTPRFSVTLSTLTPGNRGRMATQQVLVVAFGQRPLVRWYPVLADHRCGEFRGHAAGRRERIDEPNSPMPAGRPVGTERGHDVGRARPADLELGERREVDDPGGIAHRPAFGADRRKPGGLAEGQRLPGIAGGLSCEPVGPLPAIGGAEHGSLALLRFERRRHPARPCPAGRSS